MKAMRLRTATPLLALAGLFVIGLVLFGRGLGFGFVELDDPLLIVQNPIVQSFTWSHVASAFTRFDPELYIPLTFLSYQVDALFGGISPTVIHLHSLLQHVLNAWLLFLVTRELFRNKVGIAIAAAVLFLVHPLQIETVLWASGRKDVLFATFYLLSLFFWLKNAREQSRWSYGASVGCFLLSLLSKVTGATLPLVILLIEWRRGTSMKKTAWKLLPFFALSVIFGIVAIVGKASAAHVKFVTMVLASSYSFLCTLWKMVLPMHLSPLYVYGSPMTVWSLTLSASVLIVMALIVCAVMLRKRAPNFTAGLGCLLVTFLPSVGNLIKDGTFYVTSDRYAYVPLMIAAVLLASALHAKLSRALFAIVTVTIAAALSIVTVLHIGIWSDSENLSRSIVTVQPQSALAHEWYGNALRDAGETDRAIAQYAAALAINDSAHTHYNRALALEDLGKNDEAIAAYRDALAREPLYALGHVNLGRLLYLGSKKDEAKLEWMRAADLAPELAMPKYNLGLLAVEKKQFAEAERQFRAALESEPTFSDARANLALTLLALGKRGEAIVELTQTLTEDPTNQTALGMRAELLKRGIIK